MLKLMLALATMQSCPDINIILNKSQSNLAAAQDI